MTEITIINIDDKPVKRYGFEFQPDEAKNIDSSTIIAYSLMEMSLTLQRINKKLGKIVDINSIEHIHTIQDRNFGKPQSIIIDNFPDTDPWIIRKIKQYNERRRFKKRMRQLNK